MGKIILLNTPIGNLGDLTPRVRTALNDGRLFAVEDTRVFKDLLGHLGISLSGKKIFSLHDQSSSNQVQKLLNFAVEEDLFVASEAGSPIVSDPAFPLVVAAIDEGFEIESLSGVSSPVMALELSGLPPIPFKFHGFLPREAGKRKNIFLGLDVGTHIFFEAPKRIEATLDDLSVTLPEVDLVVVRELSKKFQQVTRLKASQWKDTKEEVVYKGEFIFLVHQKCASRIHEDNLVSLSQEILAKGPNPRRLSKLLGEILDRPTKEIYSQLGHKKPGH